MKKSIVAKPKLLFICLLVISLLSISAYATTVDLGTAANFAVLGASGVTNGGGALTYITGDVGSSPTPSVTGLIAAQVDGILYLNPDPATAQAHTDLIAAYTAALNAPGGVGGPADLGGATLTPGVYTYATTAPWTAGTLTLDGQGNPNAEWIFQIGTGLTTPAGATVALINGASANNVFWQVGSAATLGATNAFAGNILAGQSITLGGGTLYGRALAVEALVSIPTATTITVPEPATLCLLGLGALGLLRKRRA
jgi:hypothetical protein